MQVKPIVACGLLALLGACSTVSMDPGAPSVASAPVGEMPMAPSLPGQRQLLDDMPFPPGSELLRDAQSLVLGGGEAWVGRVMIKSSTDGPDTAAYLRQEWTNSGWTLLSYVTGNGGSVLTLTKGARTATVEIQDGSGFIGGRASVRLTLSPRPGALNAAPGR